MLGVAPSINTKVPLVTVTAPLCVTVKVFAPLVIAVVAVLPVVWITVVPTGAVIAVLIVNSCCSNVSVAMSPASISAAGTSST